MKNISLLEVSALVFVAIVCSITVKANEELTEKATLAQTQPEPQIKTSVEAKTASIGEMIAHNKFFAPLDIDNNGVISEQELGMSKNKLFKEQFQKIDTNKDQGISEEELKSFLAKVDIKKNF